MTVIYDKNKNSITELIKLLKDKNNTNYFFDIANIVIKFEDNKEDYELNDVKTISLNKNGEYEFEF